MSLSWTPFLNDFFSCLLLALLFSCHSLAHVSSLLLGNALFTRCGSALLSFITSFWISSFFALSVDNPLSSTDVIFSGIIQSGHVCPNCWLQLELCSLHGVAAPPHALPRAARPVHAHHTLCVSRARLLWVVTPFQATTTLLVSHKETVSFFSALSAPLCGSLQRRTRGLHVWHLRHHCVVVGSR